jgi:hypothetical protein
MKYRSKPVEKEAIQFLGEKNRFEIAEWAIKQNGAKDVEFIDLVDGGLALKIHTLEGTMTANTGDFIIKGLAGEFYPCKPEIFKKSYEPAEEKQESGRE